MGMKTRMTYEERRQEWFRLLVLQGLGIICHLFLAQATKNLGGREKEMVNKYGRDLEDFTKDEDTH